MAMGTMTLIGIGLTVVNVALLATLSIIWLRNYRRFRTPLVLGLLAFSVVLLIENIVAIYYFLGMGMLFTPDPSVQMVVAALRALQLVALGFLTYVTIK
jgi:hypothetical protein